MQTSIGIVDGHPGDLGTFCQAFYAAGYDVEGVSSFVDAMGLIAARPRGALVVSVELGAFNGLHVMLRCLAVHPATKVVVVGPDSADLRNHALALGASAYASRPIAAEALVYRVNDFFARKPGLHIVVKPQSTTRRRQSSARPWQPITDLPSADERARGALLRHAVNKR
jgi:DNA-binding response OmpR family regulator